MAEIMELMGNWFPGIMNPIVVLKQYILLMVIFTNLKMNLMVNAQLSCLKWLKNKESDQFIGKAKL